MPFSYALIMRAIAADPGRPMAWYLPGATHREILAIYGRLKMAGCLDGGIANVALTTLGTREIGPGPDSEGWQPRALYRDE
jgi:hypothetical protein